MGYHKPVDPRDIWEYAIRKLTDVSNIWEYATRKLTDVSNIWQYEQRITTDQSIIASDNVVLEDTNEYSRTSSSYAVVKKYYVTKCGKVRVKIKMKSEGGSCYCRIYVNDDTDTGEELYTNSTTYEEKYVDLVVKFGDIVKVDFKAGSGTAYLKDIRICFSFSDEGVIELD